MTTTQCAAANKDNLHPRRYFFNAGTSTVVRMFIDEGQTTTVMTVPTIAIPVVESYFSNLRGTRTIMPGTHVTFELCLGVMYHRSGGKTEAACSPSGSFFHVPFAGLYYAVGVLKPTVPATTAVLGRFPRGVLIKVQAEEAEADFSNINSSSDQTALLQYPGLIIIPVKELSSRNRVSFQKAVDDGFKGSQEAALLWIETTAQIQATAFLVAPVLADQTLFKCYTGKRGRGDKTLVELPKSSSPATSTSSASSGGKGSRKRTGLSQSSAASKSVSTGVGASAVGASATRQRIIKPRPGGASSLMGVVGSSGNAHSSSVLALQQQQEQQNELMRARAAQEQSQQRQSEQQQKLGERELEVAKLLQEQSAMKELLQQSKLDLLTAKMEREAADIKAESKQEMALMQAELERMKAEVQSASALQADKLASMLQIGANQAKVAMMVEQREMETKQTEEIHRRHNRQMEKQIEALDRQAQCNLHHSSQLLQAMAMGAAQSGTDMLQILNVANGKQHQQQQQRQLPALTEDACSTSSSPLSDVGTEK
jgi:hypothetical protein